MTKVAKNALVKGRTLSYSVNPDFAGYELRYPLKAIKECHYEAEATRLDEYPHLYYHIHAILSLEDSRDAVIFDKEVELEDEVDIMDKEDDTGEGYILPGSSIDLDLVCLSILSSSLPIRVTRPESVLPSSGKGYQVLSEEEYEQKAKEKDKASPFDVLKDYDVEK